GSRAACVPESDFHHPMLPESTYAISGRASHSAYVTVRAMSIARSDASVGVTHMRLPLNMLVRSPSFVVAIECCDNAYAILSRCWMFWCAASTPLNPTAAGM